MRTRRAAIAAVILVIVAAGPVSAATSATVAETLNVQSTLAITLDTAAFTYNASPGGVSGASTATATVSGNVAFKVSASGTDFTGPAGTIPAAAREIALALAAGGSFAPGADSWHSAGSIEPVFTGPQTTGTPASFQLQARVNLTAYPTVTAGTYTGTFTLAISPQ
jgi:hypothetical protein